MSIRGCPFLADGSVMDMINGPTTKGMNGKPQTLSDIARQIALVRTKTGGSYPLSCAQPRSSLRGKSEQG